MSRRCTFLLLVLLLPLVALRAEDEPLFTQKLNVNPSPIKEDPSVKYDYDIVYVRAKRAGDKTHKRFYTDFSQPVTMEPGADLMLLHPDGSEELLVEGGRVRSPTRSFRSTASGPITSTFTTCRTTTSGRRRRKGLTSSKST